MFNISPNSAKPITSMPDDFLLNKECLAQLDISKYVGCRILFYYFDFEF